MPLPQALQKPAEFVRSLGTARIDDKAEAKTTVTLDDVDVVAPDSDDTRPLIIVTYASVGSGHRSAARAIAAAFEHIRNNDYSDEYSNLMPQDVEIKLVDILEYGYVTFNGEETTNLFVGPTRPLYDIAWHYTFTGRLMWGGGTAWSYLMFAPFTKLVEKRHPLAIVATHIVAANAAVAARMITKQEFPVTIVPTDYGYEGFWPSRYADLICAADDWMVTEILQRRVGRDKICVTGIPVVEGFGRDYDRDAVLESYGLPKDKMIVLVMAGAKWRQPYVLFREAMEKVVPRLPEFSTLHFAFITGSDTEYADELKLQAELYDIPNMTVLNYVDRMPELMAAADLAIAKSGGLTVTECICAHLPLLLLGTSYGQERANTETVTRAGAAQHVVTPYDLILELQKIDRNHNIVELMRENGETMRRPDAAKQVALETLFRVGTVKKLPRPFMHFCIGSKPVRER